MLRESHRRPAPAYRARRGILLWMLGGAVYLLGATATAQIIIDPPEPVAGFRLRLLDLNQRFHEGVSWTDAMLNGRGISHHDVQLDITDVVDVANLGQTFEVVDELTGELRKVNGQFLARPPDHEEPSEPDLRYPYRDLPRGIDPELYPEYPEGHPDAPEDPYGTFFPGGEGHDFGALVEAEVTIPAGRWQIAIGNSGPRWLHLADVALDPPPLPSEEPPANPLLFYNRINEHQRINAGIFGMFENVAWFEDDDRPAGDMGWTAATIEVAEPVTTTLRALFGQTDGLNGFEIAVRDATDSLIANPGRPTDPTANIGENNRLFPQQHGWVLLRDGVLERPNPEGGDPLPGWGVRTLPVEMEIDLDPENPNDEPVLQPIEYPLVHVSGQKVVGPTSFQGELAVLERGEPQAVEGMLKLRRYYVPDHEDFNEVVVRDDQGQPVLDEDNRFVEEARDFVDTLPDEDTGRVRDPRDRLRQPIAQGFVDVIAWQNGEFYPPAMGFPFARQSINDDPDDYGVLVEGQILLPEDINSPENETNVIRFKDGNRSFAGLIIDLDGDGEFLDEEDSQTGDLLLPVIDDDVPANPDGTPVSVNTTGSPISPARFTGDLSSINDFGDPSGRWRSFQFFMSDNAAISGADSGLLAWDQNQPEDYEDEDSPFANPNAPLQPEHVIGPENFRSFVETIERGELVVNLDDLFMKPDDAEDPEDPEGPGTPVPREFEYSLVFEVNVDTLQWDTIGLSDILEPDFVILDPDQFTTRLDFGEGRIVVDLEGELFDGLTIDLVDATVEEILIQGEDSEFWAENPMLKDTFLFTAGTADDWDVSEFLTEGLISYRPFPPPDTLDGDYNGNGAVEQADLDLVLLHWGQSFEDLPPEWVHQRPTDGIVDQAELDGVLLHWGDRLPESASAAAVPEPSSLLLALAAAAVFGLTRAFRSVRFAACIALVAAASSLHAQSIPAPGFVGRLLDVSTPVNTHSEGLAFLRGNGLDSTLVQSDVYDLVPVANFAGSTRGDYFLNDGSEREERGEPYPGGRYFDDHLYNDPNLPVRDVHFVASLEAEVTIPRGTWQIAFGTGDGGALQLEGIDRDIVFTDRQNNRGRLVGRYFDMIDDTIIYNDNRVPFGPNTEDRGWVSGTFTVTQPTTARFFHSFHALQGNHLSEVIIRNARGGIVDIGDESEGPQDYDPTDPQVDAGWQLLQNGALGWEVRSNFESQFGPINRVAAGDPDGEVLNPIGPIEHLGGKGLLGSVTRKDKRPNLFTTAGFPEGVDLGELRDARLLLKRYSIPEFDDNFRSVEAINEWLADQQQGDPDFGPDHLGYISHIEWASNESYPQALGFDDPFGDEDNYLVVLEGQILLPVPPPDPDNDDQRILTVAFKDGTADFSGLQIDVGEHGPEGPIIGGGSNLGEPIIDDAIPTSLDGTANGGSPIQFATFDLTSPGPDRLPVTSPDDPRFEYRDFKYYFVAGEDEKFRANGQVILLPDSALLAWDQNGLVWADGQFVRAPRTPDFPADPSDPLHPEHVIRPESFRLAEHDTDGFGGMVVPNELYLDPPDPDDLMAPRIMRLQADLAEFRDEDPESPRTPMVVFEIDPETGRSDTVGIQKFDLPQLADLSTVVTREIVQHATLDVDDTIIALELLSIPDEPFTVDLLEGSVDAVVGEPTFHFIDADPRTAIWDTSKFNLPGTIGQVSFLGFSNAAAAVPEPGTLVLALLLVGLAAGCVRGRRETVR